MGIRPTKGKGKLYKQWAEHSGLPPEAIPQREEAKEAPFKAGKEEQRFRLLGGGNERQLLILYIVLGVAIIILCVGVIILLTS